MSSVVQTAGRFGRLWGRSHETFNDQTRRILSVKGPNATSFLQGLVTSDLTQPPEPPGSDSPIPSEEPVAKFNPDLRTTCFLDNKGRVVTDALMWKFGSDEHYLIDVPADAASGLEHHLRQFLLRRTKVDIIDVTPDVASHVIYGTLQTEGAPEGYHVGLDPRHPSLGMRLLSLEHPPGNLSGLISNAFPQANGTYQVLRKFSGIAEGTELTGKTALEANQELLNAVSFSKGCYLGQELTARSQFTGTIRKRILPLLLTSPQVAIPRPWNMAAARAADKDTNAAETPPLPQLSAASIGAMTMLAGSHPRRAEDEGKDEGGSGSEEDKLSEKEFEQLFYQSGGQKSTKNPEKSKKKRSHDVRSKSNVGTRLSPSFRRAWRPQPWGFSD